MATYVKFNQNKIKAILNDTLPIWISEWNVHNSGRFDKLKTTLDTPERYATFGATLTEYMNTTLSNITVFQFAMVPNRGKPMKNGIHYISYTDDDPANWASECMRPIVSVMPYEAGPAPILSGCRVRPVPPPEATEKYFFPCSRHSFL